MKCEIYIYKSTPLLTVYVLNLADRKSVQDPENWKSIGIIGVNVETLKRDLDDVRERFTEFSFAVEEKRSQLYTNHWS